LDENQIMIVLDIQMELNSNKHNGNTKRLFRNQQNLNNKTVDVHITSDFYDKLKVS